MLALVDKSVQPNCREVDLQGKCISQAGWAPPVCHPSNPRTARRIKVGMKCHSAQILFNVRYVPHTSRIIGLDCFVRLHVSSTEEWRADEARDDAPPET